MEMKKERHAGLELLRIISMLMVVLMHEIGHGGLGKGAFDGTADYCVYWLIYALSRVATNCFIMLTGYFGINSKMRPSRLFKIWCEVLFFSGITFLIAIAVGRAVPSFSEVIKVFTPLSSGAYWFATGYAALYLCMPLLNRIIAGIRDRAEFRKILLVMLFVTSVLPTLFYWADPLYVNGGYSWVWFVVLYFLAAYIRLYGIEMKKRSLAFIYLGCGLLTPALRIAAELFQSKLGATTFVDNVMDYKCPVTVIMTVAFFALFKDLELKSLRLKRIITAVAPFSFGIYLLHDSEYIRAFLWEKIDMTRFSGLLPTLLYMAAVCVIIMLTGIAAGIIYRACYRIFFLRRVEERLCRLTDKA